MGPVLSSPVTSPVPVLLAVSLVVHLILIVPRNRLEFVAESPVLCPAQFSSGALTRDNR